jgi:hypothetical protein
MYASGYGPCYDYLNIQEPTTRMAEQNLDKAIHALAIGPFSEAACAGSLMNGNAERNRTNRLDESVGLVIPFEQ